MPRILIIQTAFLGDLILTIPLITLIKKAIKDSYLSVLLIPDTKDILEGHPAVDELIVYDKNAKDKRLRSFLRLVREIKGKKFDMAILPHRSFKSAFLSWLSRIPLRIGFDKSQGRIFLNKIVCYDKGKHELERNLDLIASLGINIYEKEIYLPVSHSEGEYAAKILEEYGFKENDLIIGINPCSVWPTKRWIPERYAELINYLAMINCKSIIFGSKNDLTIAKQITDRLLPKIKTADLVGKTSLKQLSALITKCRLFVSNDSASMHIAAAHKIPVIAIFGPTIPQIGFYPYGKDNLIIEKKLPCRPCGLHGGHRCRKKTHECMKSISTAEVLEAIQKKLSRKETTMAKQVIFDI